MLGGCLFDNWTHFLISLVHIVSAIDDYFEHYVHVLLRLHSRRHSIFTIRFSNVIPYLLAKRKEVSDQVHSTIANVSLRQRGQLPAFGSDYRNTTRAGIGEYFKPVENSD